MGLSENYKEKMVEILFFREYFSDITATCRVVARASSCLF